MMKIVVFVDGGNVQEVYAPVREAEHIDVVLVDFDNLRESHDREERDAILERETEGLTATFVTTPDELNFDEGEHCENAAKELGEA